MAMKSAGGSSATTSTTTPTSSGTTLTAEVLGEQAERSTGGGSGLAVTGGSLLVGLLGLGSLSAGAWFVAASQRRRPEQD